MEWNGMEGGRWVRRRDERMEWMNEWEWNGMNEN